MNDLALTHRLVSGKFLVPYQGQIYSINPPSVVLKQMADIYYGQLISQNRFNEIPRSGPLIEQCIQKGIINRDYQKYIDLMHKECDQLKIEMFLNFHKPTNLKTLRKKLQLKAEALSALQYRVQTIKSNSLEGLAEKAKDYFIFLNSICLDDEPLIRGQHHITKRFINYCRFTINQAMSNESEIRRCIRQPYWRQLWDHKKTDLFQNALVDFISEQTIALYFSELYDYALTCEKKPDKAILEDDDCFDGWYLYQIEEHKKSKKKDRFNKDDRGGEVYVMATNQEEANDVYSLNDEGGTRILKQRADLMKSKDTVKHLEFPDVRQEIMMESNKQFISKFRK